MCFFAGHKNSSFCMFAAFGVTHPQGPLVVTGSEDNSVNVYSLNRQTVSPSKSHQVHNSQTQAIALERCRTMSARIGCESIMCFCEVCLHG